jgi:flagellar biosynthesis/type III secretory pathway chaperone
METIDRIAEMMLTLEEFSALLEHETAAIRSVNTNAIKKMAERKNYLALHYQRQLRMLFDRRGDLIELGPEVKEQLRRSWEEFDLRMQDNLQALKVAQKATRTVVDMIVNAIRDTQGVHRTNRYGNAGAMAAPPVGACVSVSLNQLL